MNGIFTVISFPEKSELVKIMLETAKDKIIHFQIVYGLILEMEFSLGREIKMNTELN